MKQAQAEQIATTLAELATPCLVLDAERMERNIARLKARLDGLGVALRPHLKTSKSVDVARRVMTSRILPNHACATGAQHRVYHVVRGASVNVEAQWPRFGGWQ